MTRREISKHTQKAVEKYICKVQPLSKGEKEELRMRIQTAIQNFTHTHLQ